MRSNILSSTSLSLALICCVTPAIAEPVRSSVEGVQGYLDKDRRSPVLTVSHEVFEDNTEILADAHMLNGSLSEFPIQFDFYVDRKLFDSQYRSVGQTGPVGIRVPSSVTPAPFTYTVVATLLHTNRQYKTVYEATASEAAQSSSSSSASSENGSLDNVIPTTIDCSLDITTDGTVTTFNADSIATSSVNEEAITFTFTAQEEEGTGTRSVSVSLTQNAETETAQGTVSITNSSSDASVPVSHTVTGSFEVSDGTVSLVEVSTEDDSVDLSCL